MAYVVVVFYWTPSPSIARFWPSHFYFVRHEKTYTTCLNFFPGLTLLEGAAGVLPSGGVHLAGLASFKKR